MPLSMLRHGIRRGLLGAAREKIEEVSGAVVDRLVGPPEVIR
jgi:hypothetical protein